MISTLVTSKMLVDVRWWRFAVRTRVVAAMILLLGACLSVQGQQPPQITSQPQDQSVSSGSSLSFGVSATGTPPLRYQWRFNGANIPNATSNTLLLTNVTLLRGGLYSAVVTNAFGAATSDVARLTIDDHLTFRMVALQTNGYVAVEAMNVINYSRGGIALSSNSVFLTGSGPNFNGITGRWRKQDLTQGTSLGVLWDALTGDLRTEKTYTLANGNTPLTTIGTITSLIEINDAGTLTANRINLSTPITLVGFETGIFAGYGRIVIYDQGDVYDIALPSGVVTYLGSSYIPYHNYSQNYNLRAFWGVAEYFRGDIHLVYGQDTSSIARFRVRDGFRETVAAFGAFEQGLSSMASFTFSPSLSRWFFHYEGQGIFGSRTETLGSAKAVYTRDSAFPDITQDPSSATTNAGATATLSVTATGDNLSFQWLFNGGEILGATNTTLTISNVAPADAGTYKVMVSNPSGSALSKPAVLTVLTVPVILFGPQSLAVDANTNVTMTVSAAGPPPLSYQWRFKGAILAGETNSTLQLTNVQAADEGLYSVVISNSWGSTASLEARLKLIALFPEGASFRVLNLGASNSKIIDDRNLISYERGGIASTLNRLIYCGSVTEQVDLENLSNPTTRSSLEAIASDLRTGTAYLFAQTNTPISYYQIATHLLELNGTTGLTNGRRVALSAPIPMPGTYNQNVGFFSGYGRILVYNETNMYSIALPSGQVTNLGAMPTMAHSYAPTWSFWGIAEYYGGRHYVLYVRDNRTIVRTRVPDGTTTTWATFANIGGISSFTVSLYHNRWYFHYSGANQFGGTNQNLGYADAAFEISPIDHFEWGPIASPQVANSPFNVRLTAKAFNNSTVSNFSGSVNLFGVAVPAGTNIPVLPTTAANFVDGIWNGQVTVPQPAAAMYLRAADTSGFSGNSSNFVVLPLNDLFVTVADSPDPVVVGQPLTYTIAVNNTGPASATGVMLTNLLPLSAIIQSVNSSLGTCVPENNTVRCDLGEIAGATAATVSIQVTPTAIGSITNRAIISRAEADADPSNNVATAVTTVTLPALSVSDASLLEENSGTNFMTFTVSLSGPATNTVTVNYVTFNGTAFSSSDYVTKSGSLTFAPGVTNQTVQVGVRGDTLYETNEAFGLGLNTPVNAIVARSSGIGTIINDDAAPTVFISDATVVEGNSGTTNMAFQVRLSGPTGLQVLIGYSTSNGTATAGTDFTALNSVISFGAGTLTLTQNIQVPIIGDTIAESNEFFYMNFNFVSNAPAARLQAIGTILNEDGIGVLDHFVFSPIASPEPLATPFPITITAKDFFSTTISNFNGTVGLDAEIGLPPPTNFILTNIEGENVGGSGNYTLGYSFTPAHDITVTHFRHYFGTKLYLWTDAGTLLASQSVTNVDEGAWTDIPLDKPLVLFGGMHYRIATYTGVNGNYYYPMIQTSLFPDGTIDRSLYALDDAFPTNRTSPWWLVDLLYSPGKITPILMTPTNSGSFSNGTWSGAVTLLSAGSNVIIRASDSAKNSGVSTPFDVTTCRDCDGDGIWDDWELAQGLNPFDASDGAQDPDHDGHTNWQEFMAGTDPHSSNSVTRISQVLVVGNDLRLRFNGMTGKRYRLERNDGMSSNWTGIVTFKVGSTRVIDLIDSSAMQRTNSFYRVRLLP